MIWPFGGAKELREQFARDVTERLRVEFEAASLEVQGRRFVLRGVPGDLDLEPAERFGEWCDAGVDRAHVVEDLVESVGLAQGLLAATRGAPIASPDFDEAAMRASLDAVGGFLAANDAAALAELDELARLANEEHAAKKRGS